MSGVQFAPVDECNRQGCLRSRCHLLKLVLRKSTNLSWLTSACSESTRKRTYRILVVATRLEVGVYVYARARAYVCVRMRVRLYLCIYNL